MAVCVEQRKQFDDELKSYGKERQKKASGYYLQTDTKVPTALAASPVAILG
jgi:hypothetical protein